MMLILTGTTGHLGSRVLKYILYHGLINPSEIIISSSNPDNVHKQARDSGIEVRKGDFTSPKSLQASFKGGDVLFLVSFPSPSVDRWLHHKTAIDAAKAAGIQTIIYTSLMFGGATGMHSIAGVQKAHVKTIEYLSRCGLRYIVIREGIYAESWWLYSGFQQQTFGRSEASDIEFVIPNDGPVAWVSWDDLAEGTAKILQNYSAYIGQTLRLTGPRTATLADIAKLVQRHSGRSVNVKIVGREQAEAYHKSKKSVPESQFWVIESWVGWHDALANGETATVDPLLEKLLGRSPKGIEEMAATLFIPQ